MNRLTILLVVVVFALLLCLVAMPARKDSTVAHFDCQAHNNQRSAGQITKLQVPAPKKVHFSKTVDVRLFRKSDDAKKDVTRAL